MSKRFRKTGAATMVREDTRREPPPIAPVIVRVTFDDGVVLLVESPSVGEVRRRLSGAVSLQRPSKLPDGRWVSVEAARRVVAVEAATQEVAVERRYTDDCTRAPRWWHGRQRRAQVARSDPRLTDPEGARREPAAARARRGQAALEALLRELRERAT